MVPKQVVPDRRGLVEIGKIKENLVTEVAFDCADLGDGSGAYAVVFQRPKDAAPYPVAFRAEWPSIVWVVQAADTAKPGTGKVEIRWYGDGNQVGKSKTYMVRITDGLSDPTEAPEAWEGFMGQVARNAQAAQTAAGEAKANADGAAASAGIAQGAAAEAGKQAGAAGDAANAAASAASAASSAQAGAETAGQNALAAAEAAETARSGAEAAKLAAGESATGAAGSAEAAAQAAQKGENLYNQVKADLAAGKLKGEKGEKGDPGKDAPQIDDSVVSADNPWSSRHIVETLCPPIAETGNPVTCYPVAGYPLGGVASWAPTQAGEGEPSPENIRPISGRDSVGVERCWENLVKFPYYTPAASRNGLVITSQQDGSITVNGTATADTWVAINLAIEKRLPMNTPMALSGCPAGGSTKSYYIGLYLGGKWFADIGNGNTDVKFTTREISSRIEVSIIRGTVCNNLTFYPKIEVGTAITPYSKYQGSINTLTLPETVYGGEVDAVSGEGQESWKLLTLDGTEQWRVNNQSAETSVFVTTFAQFALPFDGTSKNLEIFSSHFKKATRLYFDAALPGTLWYNNDGTQIRIAWNPGDDPAATVESFTSFLSAQAAAGTPVQIAYKLATPAPFTATGAQPIMPLEGETNTIMTDADAVTITGRADLAHAIAALQAQLAVATQQLAETQAAVVDTTAMAVDYIYEQDSKIFGGEDDDDQTDAMPT